MAPYPRWDRFWGRTAIFTASHPKVVNSTGAPFLSLLHHQARVAHGQKPYSTALPAGATALHRLADSHSACGATSTAQHLPAETCHAVTATAAELSSESFRSGIYAWLQTGRHSPANRNLS